MTDIKNQFPDSQRHFDEAISELVAERDALKAALSGLVDTAQCDLLTSDKADEVMTLYVHRNEWAAAVDVLGLPPPKGLARSDADFWLRNRSAILGAIAEHGLALVSTASGCSLMKLGKVEAQTVEPKQEPVAMAGKLADLRRRLFEAPQFEPMSLRGADCVVAVLELVDEIEALYAVPVAQAEDRHEKTRGDVAPMFDQAVSLAQELDHYWTGSRWVKDGSHTPVVNQEVVSKPGSTLEVTRCKLSTSMRNGLSAPVAEIGGGMVAPNIFEGAGGGRCAVGGHVDGSVVRMTPTDEASTVAFPVYSLQRASAPSTNEPAAPQKYEPLNDDERTELVHLRSLVNTPQLHDFAHAVVLEAAHQRDRWGSGHDAGKAPQDWFWLLGYLGGKALAAHTAGNTEKALHHTISSAAALANWHAAISGSHTTMRPGIDPSAHGIKENSNE